jgi:hypothetical protein
VTIGADVESRPVEPGTLRERQRRAVSEIVRAGDAQVANRRITQAHFELSGILADVLGADTGPNFHTWAVWGSREAGRTIGRRDVTGLTAWVALAGAAAGLALGWTTGLGALPGAVAFAVVAASLTSCLLRRASRHISHGNRIVLDEIGQVTLGYVAARERGDDVESFLSTLEPGPTDRGGQDLLHRAFRAYDAASRETDRSLRHQLVFAANCFAVKHEHVRLQHDIRRSLPRPIRRFITGRLLDFWVGAEHLHVARDLTPVDRGLYPATLQLLTVPDALDADTELRDRARSDCGLDGSGAADWSVLAMRMNYVVDLFRSRHCVPEVFAAPYPDDAVPSLPTA